MDEYIELGGKIELIRGYCRNIQEGNVDAGDEAARIEDAMDEVEDLLKT